MTKAASVALKAHMALGTTTLATCWKCTRSDGQVFTFTDHDQAIVFNGLTYEAAGGYSAAAIQASDKLNVDNLEIDGLLDSESITEEDLLAGRWNSASIEIFAVNWNDISQGRMLERVGTLGNVTIKRTTFTAELRGLMQPLQQPFGRVYTPQCNTDLGDARCKVRLNPPAWDASTAYTVRPARDAGLGSVVRPSAENARHFKCTTAGTSGGTEPAWNTTIGGTTNDGSVVWTTIQALTVTGTLTNVGSKRTFTDTSRLEDDDFFAGGLLTWTSGLNDGLSMEVKSFASSIITLQQPMVLDVEVGDTYILTAGCGKTVEDCKTKFDNILNMRGFPYFPGNDRVITGT